MHEKGMSSLDEKITRNDNSTLRSIILHPWGVWQKLHSTPKFKSVAWWENEKQFKTAERRNT